MFLTAELSLCTPPPPTFLRSGRLSREKVKNRTWRQDYNSSLLEAEEEQELKTDLGYTERHC